MTREWRYFHTPNHIFEVGSSQDAIEVLAALFHDLEIECIRKNKHEIGSRE